MITILGFARLCGCNAQTLRYYDRIGLLTPEKVDEYMDFVERRMDNPELWKELGLDAEREAANGPFTAWRRSLILSKAIISNPSGSVLRGLTLNPAGVSAMRTETKRLRNRISACRKGGKKWHRYQVISPGAGCP